jgi:hypothetical protein
VNVISIGFKAHLHAIEQRGVPLLSYRAGLRLFH